MSEKNLLINGNFDLWQRGLSFSIPYNAAYSNVGASGSTLTAQTEKIADRWYAIDAQIRGAGSTGLIELYREELTTPVNGIRGNAKYYLTIVNQITGVTVGSLFIENKQDDAKSFVNIPVTLTFAAKSLNGVTGITMACYYRQAINPNVSETSYVNSSVISITPNWKTYSVSFSILPITTSGLSGDHYFGVGFKINPQNNLSIASVKLQPSKSENDSILITDFNEEKKLQSKYYYTTYTVNTEKTTATLLNNNDINAIYFTVTPNYSTNVKFDVPMYKTPSVSLYSPKSGVINDGYNKTASKDMRLTSGTRGWNSVTRFSPTGAATLVASGNTYGVELNVASGAVIFDDILVHMVADADLNYSPNDRGPV